ncbi:MAG TPA: hypothetical protein VGA69_10855 [Nitriliruptorales bacterium]
MTTRIRARCRHCSHEEELDIHDVVLLASPDRQTPSQVMFDCPACVRRTSVVVDAQVAGTLEGRGVSIVREPQRRRFRLEARPTGPALTYDDLLDLHLLLEQPDWFEQLVGGAC